MLLSKADLEAVKLSEYCLKTCCCCT